MAITVKKSTLTLKKTEETPAAHAPNVPHSTRGPVLGSADTGPSWTFYAMAGLIGMFFMGGVILLQYLEYAHYQDAFPIRTPQAAAAAPAAKPAAKAEPAAAKPATNVQPAAEEPAAKAPAEKAAAPAAETSAPPAQTAAPAAVDAK